MEKSVFIFDFQDFLNNLRQDQEKKDMIEEYENLFGSLEGKSVEETLFYTEYLSRFKLPVGFVDCLAKPEDLESDFDYELLLRCVISSFSSDYDLKYNEKTDKFSLVISVKSRGDSIDKTVDELWSFQILRLFEIYLGEQMSLAVLTQENDGEKQAIEKERKMKLVKFDKKIENALRVKDMIIEIHKLQNDFKKLIS